MPFYGQGMNCAFEDALILYELILANNGSFEVAIPQFSKTRAPAVDALIQLSNMNYVEMRSHTATTWYAAKKHLEDVKQKKISILSLFFFVLHVVIFFLCVVCSLCFQWLFLHFPSLWQPVYPAVSFSVK